MFLALTLMNPVAADFIKNVFRQEPFAPSPTQIVGLLASPPP